MGKQRIDADITEGQSDISRKGLMPEPTLTDLFDELGAKAGRYAKAFDAPPRAPQKSQAPANIL